MGTVTFATAYTLSALQICVHVLIAYREMYSNIWMCCLYNIACKSQICFFVKHISLSASYKHKVSVEFYNNRYAFVVNALMDIKLFEDNNATVIRTICMASW